VAADLKHPGLARFVLKQPITMDLKTRAKQLSQDLPALFLALKRPDVPWTAKVLAALTVAYALSPVDLIPDFIPVLGYLDDLIILPLLAALTVKLIPASILAECREQAAHQWENGKPRKWFYAIPIILIWLILLYWLLSLVLSHLGG